MLAQIVASGESGAKTSQPRVTTPPGVVQRALAGNRLSMQLTNCGSFASSLFSGCCSSDGGLEFPRGSGKLLGFAGGLWLSGRVTSKEQQTAAAPWHPRAPANSRWRET